MLDELAARCEFPDLTEVTCAVSGGADSCALLVLARHVGLEVTAVHVDHGLRSGSSEEAHVVEALAGRFGARFRAVTVIIEQGANLEARARAGRYGALPAGVLTGHTADDQAETVLLQLMRGAGLDGSAGARPMNRPLLGLRRAETVALCDHLHITPVMDPSNNDPRHRRNRVRHEVIPLLCEVAERDVVPLLARAAAVSRLDVDHLNDLASTLDPTDVATLRAAPEALRRRALRLWLSDEHPPGAAALERVLRVVDGDHRSTEIGAGRVVRRSAGRLFLEVGP